MADFLTNDIAEEITGNLMDKMIQIQQIDNRLVKGFMESLTVKEMTLIAPMVPFASKVQEMPEADMYVVFSTCLNESVTVLNLYLLAGIDIEKQASFYEAAIPEKVTEAMGEIKNALANLKLLLEPVAEVIEPTPEPVKDEIWD